MKHETVAMILAGGQGSRLGALTQDIAKPAVHFGGKYRIIDFPLSNCSNSGLEVVGVLTQYQPLQLNTYIGSGAAWDLNRMDAGVYVLPPYMSNENDDWYKGTANAIYQNMAFIDNFTPDNVVVLGGDHIYKMDYAKMVAEHKRNKAIATIAVIEVPWEEASRFGILESDADGRVVEFVEKPKNPKSNLASMGIYVFDWETLRDHLIVDEANPDSENDFGNNIIPQMLAQSKDVFTYKFEGYWKDVGTVTSLWESNMDLIDTVVDGKVMAPKFDLHDTKWRIYSKNPVKPPHYIAPEAKVANSCITEGCEIYGSVTNSIIFEGVVIGKGSVIDECVIMPNTIIGENVVIKKTIVGENVSIENNCRIGVDEMVGNPYYSPMCNEGVVLVGNEIIINENMIVPQQSMIKKNVIVQDSKIRENINKDKAAEMKDSKDVAKTEIA